MVLVVLVMSSIQVGGSVQVSSVISNDLLEELHDRSVLMSIVGSFEEYAGVEVRHLIISHEDERRSVGRLVRVGKNDFFSSLKMTELLLGEGGNLLSINGTSCYNSEVLTGLVSINPVSEHVRGDVSNIFSDTEGRLSDLMLAIRGVNGTLKGGLLLVTLKLDDASVNCLSLSLNLVLVEGRVVEKITDDFEGFRNSGSLQGQNNVVVLSVGINDNISSKSGNLGFDVSSSSGLGSSESETSEEVNEAGGLSSLVTSSEAPMEAEGNKSG